MEPSTLDQPHPVVTVMGLRSKPVSAPLTLVGEIEPWQQAVLYFEVSGVLAETLVEEGQEVQPGAPIASLVLDDYKLAVARAQAELDAAQAQLDLLRAGTRHEDVQAAAADYNQARVRAAYWLKEFTRQFKLFETASISTSEFEQVKREHDAATQQERAAKARYERAVAGPRREEIEAAAAQTRAFTQAVAQAKRQLDKAVLKAPFQGFVEKRLLDAGAYINVFPTGGVPMVHLIDLKQVDAVVSVPEALLGRVRGRSQVEIVSAIDPQLRANGEIIALGQVADRATGTYELRARISNADGRFKGGMVVTMRSDVQANHQAIQVPIGVLRSAYGQPPYVLLVDAKHNRVVSRDVQVGPIHGNEIEVTRGLLDGDLLIVSGQDRVLAGDLVQYQGVTGASIARVGAAQ